ncbi:procathepsin L [Nothobranchius furzeri]|uniref:Cathepsin L1-like n=2 Tax=Nothobranchius furzeri TaxID=105023 RepID=A0A8C6L756_NOTFU|nr:cathepsin L1-like [Nothobranchius furzeri]
MLPAVLLTVFLSGVLSAPSRDLELDQHWDRWKAWHKKNYNENEEGWRRMVWEKNLQRIEMHNLEQSMGKHTYRLGMNQFGDMTNEEFRQIMTSFKPTEDGKTQGSLFMKPNFLEAPSSVDWRPLGYVTAVKNQGPCGSCWAFSATGALEGQLFRMAGKLVLLSEQNLVDCSIPEGNHGCGGGWMNSAFQYVVDQGGLDTEACYPYRGRNQACGYNPSCSAVNVTGYVNVPEGSEAALMDAVASVGPVSVAIDASKYSFQFYSSGVYYEPSCSPTPDHGVLVVGYGSTSSENYWLVKNSWGTGWGDQGYILMSKDKNNNCAIASYASYPLVG